MLLYLIRFPLFHARHGMSVSLNRAAYMVTATGGADMPPRREMKRLWQRHRGAAPLAAAARVGTPAGGRDDVPRFACTPADVQRVLEWAAWIQEFATQHQAPSAKGPLLAPGEGVVFPPGIEPRQPPLAELPRDLFDAAVAYAAPTRTT